MRSLKCLLGHGWEMVATTNRYHFTKRESGEDVHFFVAFFRCKKCGIRRSRCDHSFADFHEGLKATRAKWRYWGILPKVANKPTERTAELIAFPGGKEGKDGA